MHVYLSDVDIHKYVCIIVQIKVKSFLVDPMEAESPQPSTKARISTSSMYPTTYPSPPPLSPTDQSPFGYPPTAVRGRSLSKDDPNTANTSTSKDVQKNKEKVKRSTSDPQQATKG